MKRKRCAYYRHYLMSTHQSKPMGASKKPSSSLSTPSFPFSSDTNRGWSMRYIVAASSMGTIIEWYDFYIFGSLAVFLAPVFFPSKTLGTSLILYLGTFAAGFAVRPFGALVFGRLGDKIGRKYVFLLSSVLVAAALYIRWRLRETPLFTRLKEMGKTATSPIKESLGRDWRLILLALFGATAGQAVVWYTGQFYALYFLQVIRGVDKVTSYAIVATALALGTPLFIFFGRLSDRIGRKKIIMAGCGLAAATYYPLYMAMTYFSDKASFTAPAITLLVLTQVVYVTMVYGPIAALLVEMFPGRTRYTSLSLPYHLGNGEFGGFTPVLVVAINFAAGSILAGLIYPIGVALVTLVIGSLYIKETKDVSIWKEVEEMVPTTQPIGRSIDSVPEKIPSPKP